MNTFINIEIMVNFSSSFPSLFILKFADRNVYIVIYCVLTVGKS